MDKPKVTSVPNAGRIYFGSGRNKSYELARAGVIPTIRVGRKLVVPIAALERIHAQVGQGEPSAPPRHDGLAAPVMRALSADGKSGAGAGEGREREAGPQRQPLRRELPPRLNPAGKRRQKR